VLNDFVMAKFVHEKYRKLQMPKSLQFAASCKECEITEGVPQLGLFELWA
jgi:hypothetical protein